MLLTKNLPVDTGNQKSCLYWLYDKTRHTDPRTQGYVGVSTAGLENRLRAHMMSAARGSKLPVHCAIRKYGDALGSKVLLLADPEFCLLAEYLYRPQPNMRGTLNIAMGGVASPTTGTKLSPETRKKISDANSGENSPWFGRKHTLEHRDNMSKLMSGSGNAMFGAVVGEDLREKSSKAHADNIEFTKTYSTYKLLTEADCNIQEGYLAWRAPNADKNMWLEASELYDLYQSKGGCGHIRLSSLLNGKYSRGKLATICRKFRTGWIPCEDRVYVEWKDCYSLELLSGVKPKTLNAAWRNASAKRGHPVWAIADQLFEVVQDNPGIGGRRLGIMFGFTEASMVHINKKLRGGWNPSEDADWLAFKQEYKLKECNEST